MTNNPLDLQSVALYVEQHIGTFHEKRLEKLQELQLNKVLKRKNPYLFRAKNIGKAAELVEGILSAYLSSQEETLFGDFIEGVAQFVNQQVYQGYKPPTGGNLRGIDLIFQNEDKLYIVEIKSGPAWGNSSQINSMIRVFQNAKALLQPQYPHLEVIAVNGCTYGRDSTPKKESGYWKLCGQDFWEFISGNPDLYLEIIEPLGFKARERNDAFSSAYDRLVNKLTLEFGREYCNYEGAILWDKLLTFVSERDTSRHHPFDEIHS